MICIFLVFASLMLVSCNEQTPSEEQVSETQAPTKDTVLTVRLKEDVTKGSYIELKDLELVEVDPSTLPEGCITGSSEVVGKKVLSALKKGDYLTADVLGKKKEEPKEETQVTKSLARKLGYIVVTDYLKADTGEDLTEAIQKIIDDNPRKTIYFPDGVYTIARPIQTSSNANKAVSLHLSSGAVLKAADRWKGGAAHMVQLGIIDKTFSIHATGTNYYLYGGVIDGNGKAKGVALEGGRETSIRNVVIRNVTQGLHIVYNSEYGSNDSDTEALVIEGGGYAGSVGVLVDGLDNTLSNIRVSGFEVGVQLTAGGNLMHDIYATYTGGDSLDYNNSRGFLDSSGGNWYDGCRADGFRTAFYALGHSMSLYNDCVAVWHEARDRQIAIESTGKLSATVTSFKADFYEGGNNSFLVASSGGKGIIAGPMFDTSVAPDEAYKKYLVDRVVWYDN